ncbi:MAG: CPBP family intramembrane metalloprotease [Deltaproteobacteria bacterium]|nr:CPBP family intramembrane metalloprotease [Deltaproteobacteria bacterium]
MLTRRVVVREVLGSFGVSLAATIVLYQLRVIPFVRENLHALVAVVFMLLPITLLQRRNEDFGRFGIAMGGLFGAAPRRPGLVGLVRDLVSIVWRNRARIVSDAGFALVVAFAVFPAFFVGFRIYWNATRPFSFHPPPGFAAIALAQLVVVGLPEEFFYRGYVQTRMREVFPRTWRIAGADVSPMGLLATSTFFALGHFLVDLQPARLAVFFPSFLFGWMRERRGTIGASAIFHAMCNVFADTLMIGYFGR